jgi:cyclic pyranopterin phosphate synthase
MTGAGLLIDSQGRVLRDLRVSITDRCNFRCLYCLPETEAAQNFAYWAHLPNPAPIVQQWVPKTHIFLRGNRAGHPLAVRLGTENPLTGANPPAPRLEPVRASRRFRATDSMTTNGFFPQRPRAMPDSTRQLQPDRLPR